MGNTCSGKSKCNNNSSSKNKRKNQNECNKHNNYSPGGGGGLQGGRGNENYTVSTNPNQQSIYREGTITSYEDIRKVYKFDQKLIGHGSYGAVRLATQIKDPSKKLYAVKTISKEKIKCDLQLLKVELEILKQLDHPNIVKFYETYQDDKFFHLVMEYCQGGELFERIVQKQHFSEKETVQLMQKVFSAVKYLHQHGIIHRDLKPENFMYLSKQEDSEIKIIDFGLSIQNDTINQNSGKNLNAVSNKIVGTILYIAPEVLQGQYDTQCDIWSLGIITYILLCGYPPFKGKEHDEIMRQVKQAKIEFNQQEWKKVSKSGIDFVKKLLVSDPKNRINASEALEHPWLKQKFQDFNEEDDKGKIDPQIINLMKNFRSAGKFKHEVLKIVVNSLNESEIRKLRKQFRHIDINHTGNISIHELRLAMQKIGHEGTEQEVKNIMNTFNLNEITQSISYTTFIGACLDKSNYLTTDRLYNVFKQFDIDNVGYITSSNLKEVMARNGRLLDQRDIENLIKDFDLSNDNKITWEEFQRVMLMEKEEDLQSVRESWNNFESTTNFNIQRQQAHSYGQLGLEISHNGYNNNISKSNTKQQIENHPFDQNDLIEQDIKIIPLHETSKTSIKQNINSNQQKKSKHNSSTNNNLKQQYQNNNNYNNNMLNNNSLVLVQQNSSNNNTSYRTSMVSQQQSINNNNICNNNGISNRQFSNSLTVQQQQLQIDQRNQSKSTSNNKNININNNKNNNNNNNNNNCMTGSVDTNCKNIQKMDQKDKNISSFNPNDLQNNDDDDFNDNNNEYLDEHVEQNNNNNHSYKINNNYQKYCQKSQ